MRDSLVIYRWPLGDNPPPVTRLTVPVDEVIGANDWKEFSPADIAVDPLTGNYVIITAREQTLVVITPGGEVVQSGLVPGGLAHTEGVAVTRDGVRSSAPRQATHRPRFRSSVATVMHVGAAVHARRAAPSPGESQSHNSTSGCTMLRLSAIAVLLALAPASPPTGHSRAGRSVGRTRRPHGGVGVHRIG